MKWLYVILIFISCSIEKPKQVKVVYLTVIKIQKGWTTWSDFQGLEVEMEGDNFKIGDRMAYLITK